MPRFARSSVQKKGPRILAPEGRCSNARCKSRSNRRGCHLWHGGAEPASAAAYPVKMTDALVLQGGQAASQFIARLASARRDDKLRRTSRRPKHEGRSTSSFEMLRARAV